MTFVVSQQSQNRWMNLGNLTADGSNICVRFEPGVGMIVKRVVPEKVMREVMKNANAAREIFKKGKMLGTQNHWLPIATMPVSLYEQWKRELGDPKRDPVAMKKWKARLNSNEYRNFRASEHRI